LKRRFGCIARQFVESHMWAYESMTELVLDSKGQRNLKLPAQFLKSLRRVDEAVICLRDFCLVDGLAEHVSESLAVEIKVHLALDQLAATRTQTVGFLGVIEQSLDRGAQGQ
jgi:hypothetical protein